MSHSRILHHLLRKGLIITLLLSLIIGFGLEQVEALNLSAQSAVVIDAETGAVLYGKNIHQRRPPASTTKVMTAILGIELGNLKDKVKASHRAVYQEGSAIYLKEGEELTLEELLYGVMLSSGNDASVAVGEHIGKTVENFANLMTRKAKEVGALNTTFKNPNGLPNDEHLTTAYDLAMIMRYAMQNETFKTITSTKYKVITGPGSEWPTRGLRNHNKLLWETYYSDCDGGKTGFTRAAGRCLISTAIRNGRRVIATVLNAPNHYPDSIQLLDYGLDQFSNITLIKEGETVHNLDIPESVEKQLELITVRNLIVTVPKGRSSKAETKIQLSEGLRLPILAGQRMGIMEVYLDDKKVGQVDLIAKHEVREISFVRKFWRWISSIFK